MKPDLGKAFSTRWGGYPPAMPTGDYEIWQRYRPRLAEKFNECYFNVRVGEPVDFPPHLPPEIAKDAILLSRRRIDVVAFDSLMYVLIELKSLASAEALGQILMYRALWEADPPDMRPLHLVIATDSINKNVMRACEYYRVEVVVV